MIGLNSFEDEKNLLLKEALEFNSINDVSDMFKRRFFDLVTKVIIDSVSSDDSFFGNFMLKIERKIRLDISYPLSTIPEISGFKMSFNPILFLNATKREMEALFKHEIYHIMFSHYIREKELRNSYSKEAVNIALDISINQFIKHLPMECKRLDSINFEYNLSMKEDMPIDYYAEKINEAIKIREKKSKKDSKSSDKVKREYDIESAHDAWEDIDIDLDRVKDLTKKTALSSNKGDTPINILKIIDSYSEKSQITWQKLLKRMIPTVKSGYKKTIVRRDRRQSDRVDLRGKLKDSVPEIIVAIDISASMTQKDIEKIIIEVLGIIKGRVDKIKIIECDNEVRRVYNVKTPKDIKPRFNNSGSTKFSPVFDYINRNNLKDKLLIYFTDGVGEKELLISPKSKRIIWVLTGEDELSLKNSFGIIKKLNKDSVEGEGGSAALNMIRGVIHDWAR